MDGIQGTQLIGTGAPSGGAVLDGDVPCVHIPAAREGSQIGAQVWDVSAAAPPVSGAWVRDLIDALSSFRPDAGTGPAGSTDPASGVSGGGVEPTDGAVLIDLLRGLEDLKSAAAAAQARVTVAFDAAQ